MEPEARDGKAVTLRDHLRRATARSHDRLDASMRPASDWRSPDDYARFLIAQHTARVPVEEWLAKNAPSRLKPPEQTPLLERDLKRLGKAASIKHSAFNLAASGEATAIGAAWVLAGSSLGNRAMLHDMRRALPDGTEWPHEFLSSAAMSEFWKTLRVRIEVRAGPAEAAEASRAASAVFDHFLTIARSTAADAALEGVR